MYIGRSLVSKSDSSLVTFSADAAFSSSYMYIGRSLVSKSDSSLITFSADTPSRFPSKSLLVGLDGDILLHHQEDLTATEPCFVVIVDVFHVALGLDLTIHV